jgi:hypothetical protein
MITPPHPNLELDRPLTRDEMVEMIQYEGLVGIGLPEDLETARSLALDGLVAIVSDPVRKDTHDAIPHIVDTSRENDLR